MGGLVLAEVQEVLDQHAERRAPVADVVLPDDGVTGEVEHAGQRVADDRRPQVADVHLLGHVGRASSRSPPSRAASPAGCRAARRPRPPRAGGPRKSSTKVMLRKPGPATSRAATSSMVPSSAPSTASATSRGGRPSVLARASAPFACASARSDGRTTGSTACPATAAKAGASASLAMRSGSVMELPLWPTRVVRSAPVPLAGRSRAVRGPSSRYPGLSRPRSSGDRATASGAVGHRFESCRGR